MNFDCWAAGTWAAGSWVEGSWCPGDEEPPAHVFVGDGGGRLRVTGKDMRRLHREDEEYFIL